MGGNFKFQPQDSFLEYFFWEIGRFEKRISLSEKGRHGNRETSTFHN